MINRVECFSKEHLKALRLQARQQDELDIQDGAPENATLFTLFDGAEPMAVIGFVQVCARRRMAVALLSEAAGKDMLPIVRAMKRLLKIYAVDRVEMTVKTDFLAAHRLARMLGFSREGTMKKFANGQDYDLYARCL